MLYQVEYGYYDQYSHYFFEGPKVDDWQSFCNSLLGQAIEVALQEEDNYIGWDTITDKLVIILEKHGYKRAKLETASYDGSGIIKSEEESACYKSFELKLDRVVAHNEKIENDCKKGFREGEANVLGL